MNTIDIRDMKYLIRYTDKVSGTEYYIGQSGIYNDRHYFKLLNYDKLYEQIREYGFDTLEETKTAIMSNKNDIEYHLTFLNKDEEFKKRLKTESESLLEIVPVTVEFNINIKLSLATKLKVNIHEDDKYVIQVNGKYYLNHAKHFSEIYQKHLFLLFDTEQAAKSFITKMVIKNSDEFEALSGITYKEFLDKCVKIVRYEDLDDNKEEK